VCPGGRVHLTTLLATPVTRIFVTGLADELAELGAELVIGI
jgi:hypothetical protein